MPRSHRSLTQTGWFPEKTVASRSFGTTPPARPFLEFDGLAGTPPNLGGESQTPNLPIHKTRGARGVKLSANESTRLYRLAGHVLECSGNTGGTSAGAISGGDVQARI